ncbi:hypothetical protein AOQ84DRAFT_273148, partial [Glonium stellatum]
MVNSGKPSKGCKSCRERKIKCDLVRPACRQCIRIQRDCPGYRDPLDLMFRNESEVVVRKARARAQNSAESRRPRASPASRHKTGGASSSPQRAESTTSGVSSPGAFPIQSIEHSLSPTSSMQSLAPSIEDQAAGFFFAHYVIGSRHLPRGHFEYLPVMYHRTDVDESLRMSLLAAGLAGFANTLQSSELIKMARQWYVSALASTNMALQSPKDAIKDTTLVAVLILGIYENLTYQAERSFKSWADHINGAATLIRLRGREQFKTTTGLRIFQQFYGSILLGCLQNQVPVPADIIELWAYATNFFDGRAPGRIFSDIMIRFINLNVAIKNGNLFNSDAIIASAMQIDSELVKLQSNMPPMWQYQTVFTDADSELVAEGFYHVYSDLWVAQMRNNFRILRMVLNEVIREQLLKGYSSNPPLFTAPEYAVQLQLSTNAILLLASEICATVPQHAGYIPSLVPLHPTGQFVPQAQSPESESVRAAGCYYLVWPLFMVGRMTVCPDHLRLWVINRLQYIGRTIGMQQA